MSTENQTLGDALPKEIERCQELLKDYESIGPSGAFAVKMIKRDIAAAHKAMIEGDLVGMLRVYKTLQGVKG